MEKRGVDLFNGFYKNKKVLITGHTGFKGSWLSIWLKELGAKVVGYGLAPYTENDNFIVTGLKGKIIDIRGDIRNCETLQQVFTKYKPEIVFHLAAQPLVRLSYEIPKETYDVNVMGTLNVLECIRNTESVKASIMITTDKCYENKEQIWPYRETDPMGGYDPYSSSKACVEILIASYRNSFLNPNNYDKHGTSIASVRAGNVIGGGDWSRDRIIPDCIRALKENKDIEIRNPKAVRPWQHVLEPLSGYLLLASKMYEDGVSYCSAWNFGPNIESIVPVKTVADIIINKWGKGKWIDLSNKDSVHEANLLCLDCTKARVQLCWESKLNIDEAIEYTVDWYKNYKDKDVFNLCVNQIKSYCNKRVQEVI
ncbi:CDP-glucose 4,6-dehydratase [Clostridium sp.]